MKKTIAFLIICMTICLAVLQGAPAHAARVNRLAHKLAGDCTTAADGFTGYVSGSAYLGMVRGSLVVNGQTGPWFYAFQNCDSPVDQPEAKVSAASFDLFPLGKLGVLEDTVTVNRGPGSIGISEESHFGGFTLLGGLIKVGGLEVSAETNATAHLASSLNTSNFVHATIAGIPIKLAPDPNTKIDLGFATATLNKEEVNETADSSSVAVTALDIQILKTNSFNLPVGADIQIGHVEGQFSRKAPDVKGIAEVEGLSAYGQLGGSAQTGPWFSLRADDQNPHESAGVVALSLPPFGDLGGWQGNGDVEMTPLSTTASSIGSFGHLSLFNGLIRADGIKISARASIGKDGTGTSKGIGSFAGLVINGQSYAELEAPDFRVDIPGIGHAILNHTVVTRTPTGVTVEVNALELFVDLKNSFGLPVGFHVRLAHAWACANLPADLPL